MKKEKLTSSSSDMPLGHWFCFTRHYICFHTLPKSRALLLCALKRINTRGQSCLTQQSVLFVQERRTSLLLCVCIEYAAPTAASSCPQIFRPRGRPHCGSCSPSPHRWPPSSLGEAFFRTVTAECRTRALRTETVGGRAMATVTP